MPGFGVGKELWARDDWEIRLTADEIDQLERAVAVLQDREVDGIGQEHFVLGSFSERLKSAQYQLENGAGFVYVRGLPVDRFDEGNCGGYSGALLFIWARQFRKVRLVSDCSAWRMRAMRRRTRAVAVRTRAGS